MASSPKFFFVSTYKKKNIFSQNNQEVLKTEMLKNYCCLGGLSIDLDRNRKSAGTGTGSSILTGTGTGTGIHCRVSSTVT